MDSAICPICLEEIDRIVLRLVAIETESLERTTMMACIFPNCEMIPAVKDGREGTERQAMIAAELHPDP